MNLTGADAPSLVTPRYLVGTRTFDATAGNGATGSALYFTVTGQILVLYMVPYCTADLTEAAPTATISLGTTNQTALFIAATTATAIDANEVWLSTTVTNRSEILPGGTPPTTAPTVKDVAVNDADIRCQIAAQNINGGTLRITLVWVPISTNGNIVLASGVT